MRLIVCSVFDSKVGAYMPPFYCRTRLEGMRMFESAVRDEKQTFNAHKADFRLYVVGEFDDNSGMFIAQDPYPLIGADEVE